MQARYLAYTEKFENNISSISSFSAKAEKINLIREFEHFVCVHGPVAESARQNILLKPVKIALAGIAGATLVDVLLLLHIPDGDYKVYFPASNGRA